MINIYRYIRGAKRKLLSPVLTLCAKSTLVLSNVKNVKTLKINSIPIFILNGTLELGDNVKLSSGSHANPVGGSTRLCLAVTRGATLSIGDESGISNAEIYCSKKITIGKYVNIGGGVKIYDTDFHSIDWKGRSSRPDTGIRSAPVVIEDHVFIGGHSIILKGVTIGARSVVGAGSVVTKNISSDEIWAGNPAKFIKKLPK